MDNVKVEMTPEEILAITTVISVFRDTTIALQMDVPRELKRHMANILEKITLELLYDDKETN